MFGLLSTPGAWLLGQGSSFPGPTNFPGAGAGPNLTPLLILFGVGFVIMIYGQIIKSNLLLIAGLVMVSIACFAIPLLAYVL